MTYFRSFTKLRILIDSLHFLLPSITNISLLCLLLIFIYAIFGMNVFYKIKPGLPAPYPEYIAPIKQHYNFQSLESSLILLFQIFTGQNWDFIMFEYSLSKEGCVTEQNYESFSQNGPQECGNALGYIYFVSFIILMRLIMINLFLAMTIEGYFETQIEEEAVINSYQLKEFLVKWSEYDPEGTGYITFDDLVFLMFELQPPLGYKEDNIKYNFNNSFNNQLYIIHPKKRFQLQKKQVLKNMKFFNIPIYNENKVHFKDVCVKLSYQVTCILTSQRSIEISSRYVKISLENLWKSRYPTFD